MLASPSGRKHNSPGGKVIKVWRLVTLHNVTTSLKHTHTHSRAHKAQHSSGSCYPAVKQDHLKVIKQGFCVSSSCPLTSFFFHSQPLTTQWRQCGSRATQSPCQAELRHGCINLSLSLVSGRTRGQTTSSLWSSTETPPRTHDSKTKQQSREKQRLTSGGSIQRARMAKVKLNVAESRVHVEH